MQRQMWTYKGVDVFPADPNTSGIRWYARLPNGEKYRTDTKEGMRQAITAVTNNGSKRKNEPIISEELTNVFWDEINNEHLEETGQSRSGSSSPGGVNPATLGSALDSLQQGLLDDEEEEAQVTTELNALIAIHGPHVGVRQFLPG